ncbi:alkaline phosphatase family protein [Salininema proteolyticum]|uniref:Alkaline phosphatase family protein n=1 Tax=Salininema proteolyticum TaxID=1607685 RepID=A0ABV8TVH3_9ACTN
MTLPETTASYGLGSLSDVMPSAMALLGAEGERDVLSLADQVGEVEKVVVFLLDGFGALLWSRAGAAHRTFGEAAAGRLGTWRTITATSPSSTPISLASLSTGLPPGQHGILGFTGFDPASGDPFAYIRWDEGPDPREWQPRPTCGERAAAAGLTYTIVSNGAYAHTPLTDAIYRGADWIEAATPEEVVAGVRAALARPGRGIVFAYLPEVDGAGHRFGTGSEQWLEAVAYVGTAVDGLCDALPSDAALLVTADHGMVDVDDRLRVVERPALLDGVQAVCGDGRVRYVHTVAGANPGDVAAAWRAAVGDRATVLLRDEAIATGWFGPVASENRSRVGDVVVAAHDRFAITGVPSEPDRVDDLIGHHGGLTDLEMVVPLWSYRG